MSMIGKTLAHYEITSQLGKGGMGVVYQAKDRKLGRDVAIKVLPEEFAGDADRVARFQREAKLLASLNHPNIAAIYGLEESSGTNFLVLELIEGETLADQIKRGPISVEESLKLALQIAEALEAAHEKGVIHRDLKPANIKVTPEGKVKVLDFGLAKAFAGDQGVNLSNSPTLTYSPTLSDMATQQGVILGTAAYMSPEQARGKAVDKRADIWAFGCVLYEMLTGRSLFTGDDVSQTLARILERQPDFSALPPNLHPRIRLLLERCLEKEVRNRCSGISDGRVEIQKARADPGGVLAQPLTAAEHGSKLRMIIPWVAAAVILTLIIVGLAFWKLKPTPPSEPRRIIRFDYQLPEGQRLSPGSGLQYLFGSVLAVSPDGRQFAYATPAGLYLRSLDESISRPISGTEGSTRQPFFSPDGQWIGYFSPTDGKLKKIAVNGGVPVVLCEAQQFLGASWGEDDRIVFGDDPGGIMRISSNGGIPETFVKAGAAVLGYPQILPDGKSILYTSYLNAQNTESGRIMIQAIKKGEPKELFAGFQARYVPTGHLIYIQGQAFYAVPFDPGKLEVMGSTVGVERLGGAFAVSNSGTLVFVQRRTPNGWEAPQATLVWVDREGKEEPIAAPPCPYVSPKISPDGTQFTVSAMQRGSQKWKIDVFDLVHKSLIALTSGENSDLQSIWTPDGKRIIFSSGLTGSNVLCWKAADGTGEVEKLASVPGRLLMPWSISNDGKVLALAESIGSRVGISLMFMEGAHMLKPLLHSEKYNQAQPKISPSGKWMAYRSDESGQNEVYVRAFPDVDRDRRKVSTNGGGEPLWAPNGRELFYLSNDNVVMSTTLQTEPAFNFGTPKELFKSKYVSNTIGHPWDISPDGKRFIMIKPPAAAAAAPPAAAQPKIGIVLNWFEELKQRVPTK
jgi:serine/threonine protein kinase